ncbi:ABC transporter family substrate-binding protein [Mycetocola lacteus]|uniref:ABC transporter family substrate-binding protein n=1 Tax=Mycetocola lacteus TaxID=76637 RepID=A0A3L7AJV8_9MICO|nr:ABC transporter family substrate-binding protein [Mycetocola lacteus]RLP84601.1 ABC transporter family substrate-binding protein [Mycetocola lacteus]
MLSTKTRFKRFAVAGAIAGAVALTLAGCTTASPNDDSSTGNKSGGTITIATTNAFTSFNGDTPQSNLDTNGMVGYLTGTSGGLGLGSFMTLDDKYNVVPETDIGTFEKVSDEPLTVKYTLKKDLKWSDGQPITADDMLFTWASSSGYYDDATTNDAGEVTSGTRYFDLAGSTAGLDETAFPTISDDNLSLTLTYSKPFVDWNLVNMLGKPAHVIAEKAGVSLADFVKTLKDTPKGNPAAPAAVNPTLEAAAKFWNTGYDVTSMPTDKSLLVSSGPFIVSDFTAESSITLKKNPEYKGKNVPAYDELIIRFIGDTNAQVSALQNGEVNAIYPQTSADTVTALEKANAKIERGDQLAYDHLDLNFKSDVFKDKNVREAFLKTIPRQQILDSIITPVNNKAEVLNSQIYVPQNAEYKDATKVNGYDAFGKPDIEGAKALLNGATPTVRILYSSVNPNRVDTFKAIQASAKEAGFNVVDGGSKDWGKELSGGNYDASIFGWVSPGAGNSALAQIFASNGGGNYNGYNNADVDKLVADAQTALDPKALEDIKIKIDTATATDAYGLPLFQLPGVFATNGTISGIKYFGGQTGLVWNAQDWKITK